MFGRKLPVEPHNVEPLHLIPDVASRDVRIRFDVGGRTVVTHSESRRRTPAVLSLSQLGRSLSDPGPHSLLRCDCGDADCHELGEVEVSFDGPETVRWQVPIGSGLVEYEMARVQIAEELREAREFIQSKLSRTRGRKFRFHPPEDAAEFELEPNPIHRTWYLRNNLLYAAGVGIAAVVFTLLVRAVV